MDAAQRYYIAGEYARAFVDVVDDVDVVRVVLRRIVWLSRESSK